MLCLHIFQLNRDLLVRLDIGAEVDLSEGAAPDLAAEPELVPDPGLHYSSPLLPKTDRMKRRNKKLLKKSALFAAEI
jgi:hypothetical protein